MSANETAIAGQATSTRYRVVGMLCVAATIAYVGRNCLSVAAPDHVGPELNISVPAFGWVMSAFFWGYALAQIPAGWLGHRWGPRRALTCIALAWSAACAGIGLAFGFWSLFALQLLFGIAQAGIFPCSAAVIAQWLPVSRRAFASGSLGSFMSIGGALGTSLTGLALDGVQIDAIGGSLPSLSWRLLFVLYAIPGIIWAIAFYVWFRDRPEEHSEVNAAELSVIHDDRELHLDDAALPKASGHDSRSDSGFTRPKKDATETEPVPWALVVTSKDMWMIFAQQFFRAAGYIFFATWFPTFLKETRGVSTASSGLLTALPLCGVVLGGIVGGIVVDWIWNRTGSRRWSRQAVAVAAMLACAAFIATAYFVDDALLAVLLISAGSFSAALAGSCGYAVTIEKSGRHVAPVFGAMNMCGNLGAALCPIVVAWIAETSGNWNVVLVFFAGIYLAAAVCWALLDPNGTLQDPRQGRRGALT